jgi:hypothetical protein
MMSTGQIPLAGDVIEINQYQKHNVIIVHTPKLYNSCQRLLQLLPAHQAGPLNSVTGTLGKIVVPCKTHVCNNNFFLHFSFIVAI